MTFLEQFLFGFDVFQSPYRTGYAGGQFIVEGDVDGVVVFEVIVHTDHRALLKHLEGRGPGGDANGRPESPWSQG